MKDDQPPLGGWPGLVIVTMVGAALYRLATSSLTVGNGSPR